MKARPNRVADYRPAELLHYDEVASIFRVQTATIRKWVLRGELKPVVLNRKVVRFRPEDVRDLIDRHVRAASPT